MMQRLSAADRERRDRNYLVVAFYLQEHSMRKVAEKFCVSRMTVSRIIRSHARELERTVATPPEKYILGHRGT